jgi:hypothetical protein
MKFRGSVDNTLKKTYSGKPENPEEMEKFVHAYVLTKSEPRRYKPHILIYYEQYN